MTTTPSTRFSKLNWLNFHNNHCSKLAKNTFETILIGDSIISGLCRYQNIWKIFLKPLKALNSGIGGDRIQHVLWHALNLSVSSNLKNDVVLCEASKLLPDSPEDIVDGILEIVRLFKANYSHVIVVIFGILFHVDSWSVNRVCIKEANQICKIKLLRIILHFCRLSALTLANGSLNTDLYHSHRLRLVKKGILMMDESMFNSI